MADIQDLEAKFYTNEELSCIDCNFKINQCRQPKDIIICVDNGNPDAENVKRYIIDFVNAVKHNAASIMIVAYNFYIRVKFFTASEIAKLSKEEQFDATIEQTLDSFLKYDAKISFEQLVNNLNVTFGNKPDADVAFVLINASTDTNDLSTVVKPFTKLAALMSKYNAEIHTVGITATHDNLMVAKFNSISSSINTYQSIKTYAELPEALVFIASKINQVWPTVVLNYNGIVYFAKNFISFDTTELQKTVNCKFFVKWDKTASYTLAVRLNGEIYKSDIALDESEASEVDSVFKTQDKISFAHFVLGFIFDNIFNDVDQLDKFGDNIKFALDISAAAVGHLQKIETSEVPSKEVSSNSINASSNYIKCYYRLVQLEDTIKRLEQLRQVHISTKTTPVEDLCYLFECYTNNMPVDTSPAAQFLQTLAGLPKFNIGAKGLVLHTKQFDSIDTKYFSCIKVQAQQQTAREYINKLFSKDPAEQTIFILLPGPVDIYQIKTFAFAQLAVFYGIEFASVKAQVEFKNIVFSALSVAVDNLFDNKSPDHPKQIINYEHIAAVANLTFEDGRTSKPKIQVVQEEQNPDTLQLPPLTNDIEYIYNAYLNGDNIKVRLPYDIPSNRIFLAQVLTGIKLKHLRPFIDNLHSLEFHMTVLEEEHRRLIKNSKSLFALSGAALRKYVFDNFNLPADCLPVFTSGETNLEMHYKNVFLELAGLEKTSSSAEASQIPNELLAKLNSFEDLNELIKSVKEPKELFADLMPGLEFIRNFFKLSTGYDIEQDNSHKPGWRAMIYQNLFHAKSKTRKHAFELTAKLSKELMTGKAETSTVDVNLDAPANKSAVVNYTELYHDFLSAKGGFNSFDYFQNLFLMFVEDKIAEHQEEMKKAVKFNLSDQINLWLNTPDIQIAVGLMSGELYGGRLMKFVAAMQKTKTVLFKEKMQILLTGKYTIGNTQITVIKDFAKFIRGSKTKTQWAMSEENIFSLWKQNKDAMSLEEWQDMFNAKLPKIARHYNTN